MRKQQFIVFLISIALISGMSADPFLDVLRQKFAGYLMPPARPLQLIFNQSRYTPGDSAFFKAWMFQGKGQLRKGQELIHIVVSGPSGEAVLHSKFILSEGVANNYIPFPREIVAGMYQVCAYSNSTGNQKMFSRKIEIVDGKQFSEDPVYPSVVFFPEGGKVVKGVTNRIYMKASPYTGEKRLSVIIKSSKRGDKEIDIHASGFASFDLTPEKDESIAAEIKYDGAVRETHLPAVVEEGCALRVDEEAEQFTISLSVPVSSALRDKTLYCVVANQKRISFRNSFRFEKEGNVILRIPRSELPGGLSQVSVLSDDFNSLADRLIFKKDNEERMEINGVKEEYRNRERVDFGVAIPESMDNQTLMSYVITVVKKDLFNDKLFDLEYISTDAFVQAHYNVEQTGTLTRDETLQGYLAASHDKLIDWNLVAQPALPAPSLFGSAIMEIRGRAFFKESGEPVPDSTKLSVILQKELAPYDVYAIGSGSFNLKFLASIFEGDDNLFYMASLKGKELRDVRIELEADKIPACPSYSSYIPSPANDPYSEYSQKRTLVNKAFNFNAKKVLTSNVEWNSELEEELAGADIETNLDDHIPFPTMSEVVKEIIPMLALRKAEGKATVRMGLREGERSYLAPDAPLYCIDGVLSKNTEYFLSLIPSEVASIKLVIDPRKLSSIGVLGTNGVVLVRTKRIRPEPIPDNTNIPVIGITQAKFPGRPNYSTSNNSRKPDFRATLYFDSFEIKGTGSSPIHSFYTSDDVGEYVIQVHGITREGGAFYGERTFKITF